MKLWISLAVSLALSGCASMAPEYVRPEAPVAASFGAVPNGSDTAANVADLDWRSVFTDVRLQQVIATALNNNRDLRVAVLNIEKARAQYRIQDASRYPAISANVSQTASRTAAAGVTRSASAEVGVSSWELDLFGRIKSLSDEALQTYLATAQTQRSTRMSLVAEVASDWLTVQAYQQRQALAQQTLDSQSASLELTRRRHEYGVSSAVDISQIAASVESARADVASYATALAQARNALDLVVGEAVPAELLPDARHADKGVALAALPAELSSSVLLQRPDVLYAEHTLKAANADIGAARAAFFPTISLTASTGEGSDALSNLFSAGLRTWSFVPTISMPIFNAGSLRASLDASKIQKDITVAEYEKAIQTAFREVADALAERTHIDEQLAAQQAMVEQTGRAYTLSEARYRNGVDSYLTTLDSQRSLYSAQQTLITLQLSEATNRVTLYKVLGGGADAQASAS